MQKHNAVRIQRKKILSNVGFGHELLGSISKVQSMKE